MLLKNRFWRWGYRLFHKFDKIRCNSRQDRFFQISTIVNSRSLKVAILGAAGNTGRCLSLFLKQSSIVDELALYDIKSTRGLAMELSHIDTRCKVNVCNSEEPSLLEVLDDAKIVMITAGKSFSAGCLSDEIIKENADILSDLIPDVVKKCPNAMVAVSTSPIDIMIPLASEKFKMYGIPNFSRLFGVTTLNCIRANTFTAQVLRVDPECVVVPVIGGNSPQTCVPLFSQAKPCNNFTHEEVSRLTQAVKIAEINSHTKYSEEDQPLRLSMGYAAARFCVSLCKALKDQSQVTEYAYVRSCALPDVTYFTMPLNLGPDGIQKHLGVPPLSDSECKLLEIAVPELRLSIKKGEILALGSESSSSDICAREPEPCAESDYSSKVRECNSPTLVPKSHNH
ncbi:probable malate dehydrogenase, mitochondrial [Belonocnema kinseyi]|uniref:probable malate dehydrogenase, mitochondrial n=1 Tax=Belonocnema kinseyi TaxID=2817044 RepID=UPI00143D6172|nr:probable malate dehydrogenase, mitochondrial [Belonocnema kinseyi]